MSYSFMSSIISTFVPNFREQLLAELNSARRDPAGYAKVIASRKQRLELTEQEVSEATLYLTKKAPCRTAPLVLVPQINGIAQSWAQRFGQTGIRGHGNPEERLSQIGDWTGYGEIISYNLTDIKDIMTAWIVDRGVPGKGHRVSIFDCDYQQVGIGYGQYGMNRNPVVVDFAFGFIPFK